MIDPPLQPQSGGKLRVLIMTRISSVHQDRRSLDDQEAMLREYVESHYDGPIDFEVLKTQESGERLDRPDLERAQQLMEGRSVDLVVAEDLGRIMRRLQASAFCEFAEDHQVRVIAVNDHLDTARPDWRMSAMFAAIRHESYNRDTGQRIRRSHDNRFLQGGVLQGLVYGYVRPPGVKTDDGVLKDPEAGRVYDRWFAMLDDGASFSEIADWLNANGIKPGPYARRSRWDSPMVARTTRNPILKGIRVRGRMKTRRVNATGRHQSFKAPPEYLKQRPVPHLAFIEAERYDRILHKVTQRNAKHRRRMSNGRDPLAGRPKKRTRWPGQHLFCDVCGRMLEYGAHGQKDRLVCQGAKSYQCWNSISASGAVAARQLASAMMAQIASLPDFDAAFVDRVSTYLRELEANGTQRRDRLQRQAQSVQRSIGNLTGAIAEDGSSDALLQALRGAEREAQEIRHQLLELDQAAATKLKVPDIEKLREMAYEQLANAAPDSPEFGRLMQRLIDRISVYPVVLCDGGAKALRAHFTLRLTGLLPGPFQQWADDMECLAIPMQVDLFEAPDWVTYRTQVMALRKQGLTVAQAAAQVGITLSAAQHASRLQCMMDRRGLVDPYIRAADPSEAIGRLRRHKHPRYRFEPLPGYPRLGPQAAESAA